MGILGCSTGVMKMSLINQAIIFTIFKVNKKIIYGNKIV